jgi:hypothetical protein
MLPQPQDPISPLAAFAGFIGIFGIFLYFTGWVYRWAYFGFFELEVTTLNLPTESFLLVPIQVILGDFQKIFQALLVAIVTILLIHLNLWLVQIPKLSNQPTGKKASVYLLVDKVHKSFPLRLLRRLTNLFPDPFRRELIIVAWILAALFQLAQWHGTADAFRDAVDSTSTQPMVTLVSPSDKLALGRNLDDLITDPPLKGSRIIGDVKQFEAIRGRETNNTPKNRVWRLLIENGNWVYLFPAMPLDTKPDQHPPLLAVNTADGRVQLLILSRPKRDL